MGRGIMAELKRNHVYLGDALTVAKDLPDESVHCIVTSPPYFGLRDYNIDGQMGLEETPEQFVASMVVLFRELRRVLRSDGTLWLNLGDSYAGSNMTGGTLSKEGSAKREGRMFERSGGGIRSDIGNALQSIIERNPLIIGNAATIGITAHRSDVSLPNDGFPYRVFLSLFGIQRVTVKQRDNDFCQVLYPLASPCYCWVSSPVAFAAVNDTNLEIVMDSGNDISIVITEHNADSESVLGISGVSSGARVNDDGAFPIKQPRKPITESISNGKPFGYPVTFNAPLKCFPDVYLVDKSVALGDRLKSCAGHRCNFGVAKASQQQVTFTLGNSGVNLAIANVSHLFTPNSFGSLVHYSELYDKANRIANAQRPKQELGIPEMVKRALMEDGWYCRSTIIWSKPNPMPESVTDRPTKAHEYVFLLAKSPRYFYDAEAIAETAGDWGERDRSNFRNGTSDPLLKHHGLKGKPKLTGGNFSRAYADAQPNHGGESERVPYYTRNKRSVWTVTTKPFHAAHFATFPEDLIEPMILAGCPKTCCAVCGAPHVRVVEREPMVIKRSDRREQMGEHGRTQASGTMVAPAHSTTLGFTPTCNCNGDTRPGLTYDPFRGAGTTALVAHKLGRDYLGSELNPEYVELARARVEGRLKEYLAMKEGKPYMEGLFTA
jgi:DNA modification methylase